MSRFITSSLLLATMVVSAAAADTPVASGRSRTRTSRTLPARATSAAANGASAAEALFARSSITDARRFGDAALKRDPNLSQALFVLMEAAALEGDQAAELNAALRLCGANEDSDYSEIAAGRIRELAANTAVFRRYLPRLRTLAATSPERDQLRLALVSAAADGIPEFEILQQSRESGLLTDWRLIGPLGKLPNVDFDRKFAPEFDSLQQKKYGSRKVEYFQFSTGKFTIPKYLRQEGIFYASSKVFLRSGGEWRLRVETPGTMQVFIDGKLAVTRDDRRSTLPEIILETQHLEGGDHTVMVKFVAAAAPFRIAIMAPTGGLRRRNKPMLHAGPESQYVSAALHYYRGDATSAILALAELARKSNSASVQFALARCWAHFADTQESPGDDPPERSVALRAALRLSPAAAAVEEQLADREFVAGHIDESLQHLEECALPEFSVRARP